MPVARTPLWLYQDMGQVMDGILSPVQFSCWRSFPETNCSKSFGHFWKIHASEEVAYICVFVPLSVCLSFIKVSFSPHIIPSGWLDSKHELKKWIDFKLVSHCLKSLNGAHLPLRPSSFLHPFSAAPFFCIHSSVQNAILSHKVKWSALFLLPTSSNMAPLLNASIRHTSSVSSFKSPWETFLFSKTSSSAPVPWRACVSRCVLVCVCVFAVCVFEFLTSKSCVC